MAFPKFLQSGSSSSVRLNILAIIGLLLLVSFSYCASSSVHKMESTKVETRENQHDRSWESEENGKTTVEKLIRIRPICFVEDVVTGHFIPFERRLMDLVRLYVSQSRKKQEENHKIQQDINKRFSHQGFHAMRG